MLSDVQWIGLILQNLIFNAISHSPPNSSIKIEVKTGLDYCELSIINAMLDPLTETDLDNIFNRFWRKNRARETGRHTGIGLSLVKSYANSMNLEVNTSISEKGLFCLALGKIKVT